MEKLSFSTLQLIWESDTKVTRYIEAEKDAFVKIPEEFEYSESGAFYKIYTELTDEYFWLVAEYGKPEPHREKWVDVNTFKEEMNKRKSTQVELTNQSFLFYSFSSKQLYLSNSRHIRLMSKILSDKSENKFLVKRLLVNFDEFIEIIKSVNKIRFTGFNNLFNTDSKEFKAIEDLTGTSAPESFTLEATYNKGKIATFLRRLNQSRLEQQIDKLVIAGVDESGLETIYNVDTFTSQINILCSKNTEGVYEQDLIKSAIMDKVSKDER